MRYDSVFEQITSKKGAHEKICALLDFIGDSEIALSSIMLVEQRRSLEPYFLGYGILQLMYSRQVAVKHVLKTLDIPVSDQLGKSALITARDSVIGHPITTNGAAHVIVRYTLNENGFEYWSYGREETKRGSIVNYEDLIKQHLDAMEAGMGALYRHIVKFENDRRRKMRKDPLSPKLQGISYVTQQIGAALLGERYKLTFSAHAEMLLSALEAFRAGLVARQGEEFAAYEVDHVIEGVCMLQSLFPPKDERESNRYRIVSDGVEKNVKCLIQMASDIDEQEKEDLA